MSASESARERAKGCAIVTGAGRGIGRAVAIALAVRGLDVACWNHKLAGADDLSAEIEALGVRALIVPCDVSSADDVEHATRRSLAEHGTPRVVVNNAGVVRRASIEETTEADWDHVVDVNLKGPFLVTRSLLRSMRAARRGRIVNVASISATIGSARQASYAASKWGLVGFTKSLAEELRGSGIQAVAINPGSVDTDMLVGSGFAPRMTADDVARLVVWAALDAPDAIHGAALDAFGS
jgi:3-oxoacyl-[acyl-carrier protein] reductase